MSFAWKALVIEPGVCLLLNLILATIFNKKQEDPTASSMKNTSELISMRNLSGLYATNTAIFDQINAGILSRRVNYPYLVTFTCPIVFLYPAPTSMVVNGVLKMQSEIY